MTVRGASLGSMIKALRAGMLYVMMGRCRSVTFTTASKEFESWALKGVALVRRYLGGDWQGQARPLYYISPRNEVYQPVCIVIVKSLISVQMMEWDAAS
ncbi:hypothetical protein OCU04_003195 [Sclerotinia nivalis]|uniref:Uncharacterized protein n=1 Tax=Sclerotinia nivalis TaxID=352851 RepID=A0A9X0AV65_9HELO|nr:hypothetical protein OCU04_003195 [Sclerotinia nivalis]